MKKYIEVAEFELHFKNIAAEVEKALVEETSNNVKMYRYNFERICLKYQRLLYEYIDSLGLDLKHSSIHSQIKKTNQQIVETTKNQKTRETNFMFEDDESLSKLTNSTRFLNSALGEDEEDSERKELDEIEQFMTRRNMDLQFNLNESEDEHFKIKERGTLEDYLQTVEIHEKNFEKQVKEASKQRLSIKQSANLSRNRLLLKKTTLDLERIDELCKPKSSFFSLPINESNESEDKETQTTFNNSNVKWNKFYTYCVVQSPNQREEFQSEGGEQNVRSSMDQELEKFYAENGMLIGRSTQTQNESDCENIQESVRFPDSVKTIASKFNPKKARTAKVQLTAKNSKTKTAASKARTQLSDLKSKKSLNPKQKEFEKNSKQEICLPASACDQEPTQPYLAPVNPQLNCKITIEQSQPSVKVIASENQSVKSRFQKSNALNESPLMNQENQEFKKFIDASVQSPRKVILSFHSKTINLCHSVEQLISSKPLEAFSHQTVFKRKGFEEVSQRNHERKNTFKASSNSSLCKSLNKLEALNIRKIDSATDGNMEPSVEKDNSRQSIKIRKNIRKHSEFRELEIHKQKYEEKPKRDSVESLAQSEMSDFKPIGRLIQPNLVQNSPNKTLLMKKEGYARHKPKNIDEKQNFRQTVNVSNHISSSSASTYRNVPVTSEVSRVPSNAVISSVVGESKIIEKSRTRKHQKAEMLKGQSKNQEEIGQMKQHSQAVKAERVSASLHQQNIQSSETHTIGFKKHRKNKRSQDLPELQNSFKVKLSDIKNTTMISRNPFTGTRKASKFRTQAIMSQNDGVTEICKKVVSNPNSQAIKTINKLMITKSYRQKLMLYLSMIEVTHEKYCGKQCHHVTQFIEGLIGTKIQIAKEEPIAEQLLRLYNKKNCHVKTQSIS